jgi:hypothetical protein
MVPALESQQFTEGGAPEDAVDGETGVALELGQCPRGQVAEDPVDPTGVEAECAQPQLEVGHVVAALHGCAPVEEAVADAKTSLDQGVPRLEAADAVNPQAAEVLERLDRGTGAVPEDPIRVEDTVPAEDGGQPVLDVRDGRTGVPE